MLIRTATMPVEEANQNPSRRLSRRRSFGQHLTHDPGIVLLSVGR
jgi:hypothetical protein